MVIFKLFHLGIKNILIKISDGYRIIKENLPATYEQEFERIFKTTEDRYKFDAEVSRMVAYNIKESEVVLSGKKYKITI